VAQYEIEEGRDGGSGVPRWLFLMLLVGMIVVTIGVFLVFTSAASGGNGSAGVIIFIGPIPIVFGAGPDSGLLILIAVIIAVIMLVSFALMRKQILAPLND
jgi:uncharacterized membrane protein